jgi:hypothetical protein
MKNIALLFSMIVCFGGATKKTSAQNQGNPVCVFNLDSVALSENFYITGDVNFYCSIVVEADTAYTNNYSHIIDLTTTTPDFIEDTTGWAIENVTQNGDTVSFMADVPVDYWYPGQSEIAVGAKITWYNMSSLPPSLFDVTYSNMPVVTMPWVVTSSEEPEETIEEASEEISDLNVYPNPTRGPVTIEGIRDVDEEIFIYSTHGQLVKRQSLANSQNSQVALDLNGLRSGLYLLEVVSEKDRRVLRLEVQ